MLLLNNKVIQAIPLLINNKQNTSAQNFINTLTDNRQKYMYTLFNNLDITNSNISAITSTDSTILDSLANTNDVVGKYAQGILHQVYNIKYIHHFPTPIITPSSARKPQPIISNTEILPDVNMYIFPNPAKDKITVVNNLLEQNITIELYDASGRKLISEFFKDGNRTETIQLTKFSSGMYNIKIINSQSKILLNEKLVIHY